MKGPRAKAGKREATAPRMRLGTLQALTVEQFGFFNRSMAPQKVL